MLSTKAEQELKRLGVGPVRRRSGSERVRVDIGGGRVVEVERRELLRRAMGAQIALRRMELIQRHHRTESNRPILLEPQWEQIYADPAPDIRIVSAAQRGKTTRTIVDIMAQLSLGLSVGLVMPKDQKVKELVQGKLDPTIRNTELYQDMLDANDTVHFKSFRSARLHIVTSNSKSELTSFSADCMHVDERDLCDPQNLPMYPSRMNASDYKLSDEISTPTLDPPKAGDGRYTVDNIVSEFLTGDQHRWYVKCPHCDWWQVCDFYENLVNVEKDESGRILDYHIRDRAWHAKCGRDIHLCCARCGEAFDRLRPGVWRAENVGARKRSYWVEPLNLEMGPSMQALVDMFAASLGNPSKMQHFHNLFLGRTYAGGLQRFDEALFTACAGSHHMATDCAGPCTIGIDVNRPYLDIQITMHAGGRRVKILAAKTRDDPQTLVRLMRRYGVKVGCIDQDPESRFAQAVQDECQKYRIHLIRVKYASNQQAKAISVSEPGDNPAFDPPRMVTVDRTHVIDALYMVMQNRQVEWFREWKTALDGKLFDEFRNPVRIYIPPEEGRRERMAWEGGPDHQMHAAVLDLLAETLGGIRGMANYEEVSPIVVETGHSSLQSTGPGVMDEVGWVTG